MIGTGSPGREYGECGANLWDWEEGCVTAVNAGLGARCAIAAGNGVANRDYRLCRDVSAILAQSDTTH